MAIAERFGNYVERRTRSSGLSRIAISGIEQGYQRVGSPLTVPMGSSDRSTARFGQSGAGCSRLHRL